MSASACSRLVSAPVNFKENNGTVSTGSSPPSLSSSTPPWDELSDEINEPQRRTAVPNLMAIMSSSSSLSGRSVHRSLNGNSVPSRRIHRDKDDSEQQDSVFFMECSLSANEQKHVEAPASKLKRPLRKYSASGSGKISAVPVREAFDNPEDLKEAEHLLSQISEAFVGNMGSTRRENNLELTGDGTGGTYIIDDAKHTRIAVFKPEDEEANAPNNPRGRVGEMGTPSGRQGIRSGEGAVREVAAYYLDQEHFASVPFTGLVEIAHPSLHYSDGRRFPKRGSLQEFAHHDEIAGDLSPKLFSPREVHKIGILDIRIVNTDRNDGNVLVKRLPGGELKLIPIDHGYCLPDILEIAWCDWVWLDWPQSKLPFDEETKNYIASLEPDREYRFLMDSLNIRKECLVFMKITTLLLQKGCAAGLTLYQIAKLICRDKLEAPSLLEIIVAQSRALARSSKTKKEPSCLTISRSQSFFEISSTSSMSTISRFGGSDISRSALLEESPEDEIPLEMPKFDSAARRSSFSSLAAMEESRYPESFNSEFWRFLDTLLDLLVKRKAMKEQQSRSRANRQSLLPGVLSPGGYMEKQFARRMSESKQLSGRTSGSYHQQLAQTSSTAGSSLGNNLVNGALLEMDEYAAVSVPVNLSNVLSTSRRDVNNDNVSNEEDVLSCSF